MQRPLTRARSQHLIADRDDRRIAGIGPVDRAENSQHDVGGNAAGIGTKKLDLVG